jgi:hypothetical protein
MEAVAMDKLVEKGDLSPQVARAVAEALDITLKAANLATVPMLDARFAQQDAKMEARFGSIEKLIESTKVWATLLYAGLAAVFFGGLAVDHRWLVNREDQLMAQIQARSDARFAKEEVRTDQLFAEEDARTDQLSAADHARTDRLFAEDHARTDQLIAADHARTDQLIAADHARTDQLIAEQQANAKQAEVRMDAKLDQLRALLINSLLKSGNTTRISPSP